MRFRTKNSTEQSDKSSVKMFILGSPVREWSVSLCIVKIESAEFCLWPVGMRPVLKVVERNDSFLAGVVQTWL